MINRKCTDTDAKCDIVQIDEQLLSYSHMFMMAVCFPRYNSRRGRHKNLRVNYDIYIGYPVLIIPHGHDKGMN